MTGYGYTYDYTKMMFMKLFLASPNTRDGGSHVNCTFAEALDVIRKTDALTQGVQKIIYLVGWQYDGHDDRYPAFFKVNEALKRPEDETALDSMLWLIKEAKQYNTIVSVHVNFCDVYEDSPLWNTYVAANAVIRDRNGAPDPIENYNGKPCYKVSFKEEWESGLFVERFHRLLDLLPIQKLGTMHVDNFLCCYNNCPEVDIAEMQSYRDKILDYIRLCGIDVTSEFPYREGPAGRETYSHFCMGTTMYPISTLGRIPAFWWFDNLTDEEVCALPPAYFGGGLCHDPAFASVLYGNMHGEDIWVGDNLTDDKWCAPFLRQFCMVQVPYFWLCEHKRLSVVTAPDGSKTVTHESGIVCRGIDQSITQNGMTLKTDRRMLLPLPHGTMSRTQSTFIAYSDDAGEFAFTVPGTESITDENPVSAHVFRITPHGNEPKDDAEIRYGAVTLYLEAGEAVLLTL